MELHERWRYTNPLISAKTDQFIHFYCWHQTAENLYCHSILLFCHTKPLPSTWPFLLNVRNVRFKFRKWIWWLTKMMTLFLTNLDSKQYYTKCVSISIRLVRYIVLIRALPQINVNLDKTINKQHIQKLTENTQCVNRYQFEIVKSDK